MSVIFLLIPLSVLFAAAFLAAFFWAVRSGQFEDTCTPSMRILSDDASVVPGAQIRGTHRQGAGSRTTGDEEDEPRAAAAAETGAKGATRMR
jgi:cbb3-type cytochrome oxidase maturation protein